MCLINLHLYERVTAELTVRLICPIMGVQEARRLQQKTEVVIHDESGNPGGDFVVRSVELYNITLDACMLEVHTDGTVEKEPDLFADLTEVTIALVEKVQAIANGEEADLDAFAAGLKEQYPDMAEMVDVYLEMYQVLGADAFISVLNFAAEDTVPQE